MNIHVKILALRNKKLSYRAIANKLGVSKTAVDYHCNKVKFCAKQQTARRRKKQILLDLYNNACSNCGYSKSREALDFHHKDPNDKIECISNGIRLGWSIEKLKKEASKCILLCSNCHHELHDGLLTI